MEKMCRALKVSRGGYYAWIKRKPGKRELENNQLLARIKEIYRESRESYGSPRITDTLCQEGYRVSRPRIARIMRKNAIRAVGSRKFKVTTDKDHKYPISPNLLKQNFTAEAPFKIWTSDITYIPTGEGWLYLTAILDLFNRQVVGWSISNRLTASTTTLPALERAYNRFRPSSGLIFHSDRGVQYACHNFREKINVYKMIQSMSGKGNCYDNAVTESLFSTIKKELIYRFSFKTRLQAKSAIFEYIEVFYNRIRKHSFLGNVPPAFFNLKKKAA